MSVCPSHVAEQGRWYSNSRLCGGIRRHPEGDWMLLLSPIRLGRMFVWCWCQMSSCFCLCVRFRWGQLSDAVWGPGQLLPGCLCHWHVHQVSVRVCRLTWLHVHVTELWCFFFLFVFAAGYLASVCLCGTIWVLGCWRAGCSPVCLASASTGKSTRWRITPSSRYWCSNTATQHTR